MYLSPPPRPTPTLAGGIFDVNTLVSDSFLERPAFGGNSRYLLARGGDSPELESGRPYIIDLEILKTIYIGAHGLWTSLALSPNGKQIAGCGFVEGREGIYIIDRERDQMSYFGDGCWPTWSPDGGQLAYVHFQNEGRGNLEGLAQIRVRDLVTNAETTVFEDPDTFDTGWFIADLIWSHSQDRLAFSAALEISFDNEGVPIPDTNVGRLYNIALDSNDIVVLSDEKQDVASPVFLPRDQGIMYVDRSAPLEADGDYLKVTDSAGSCRQLNPPVSGIRTIALSPIGDRVAIGTQYGLLIADSSIVLGDNIWGEAIPCDNQPKN